MHFNAVASLVHAIYIVCLSSTLQSCKTQTRNPGLRASKPYFSSVQYMEAFSACTIGFSAH